MDDSLNRKYIAIKPKGLNHYLWFEQEKVITEFGCFIGQSGWGEGGAFTNIKCKIDQIESFIYSDQLQYE
ncbi:MAG: hypothetical protein WBP45_14700 [Daejeonella sp.]